MYCLHKHPSKPSRREDVGKLGHNTPSSLPELTEDLETKMPAHKVDTFFWNSCCASSHESTRTRSANTWGEKIFTWSGKLLMCELNKSSQCRNFEKDLMYWRGFSVPLDSLSHGMRFTYSKIQVILIFGILFLVCRSNDAMIPKESVKTLQKQKYNFKNTKKSLFK